ncbi:unnamed protein product [Vitrella brassicaformis CCMP3155]|uniref:C3H1-type domain-containing protein n=1 Tax=Vitrella brassicaformis (strain CCMP3155) TaxID=1169540 RepID=A0A0G4EB41_VITBC|nr:unnamed protein product [Vitrella brassicaformis CCMP3155]|eukprot:CEL92468.1 unnamed protein product [Vitrella brassicaformis CCMP3155]
MVEAPPDTVAHTEEIPLATHDDVASPARTRIDETTTRKRVPKGLELIWNDLQGIEDSSSDEDSTADRGVLLSTPTSSCAFVGEITEEIKAMIPRDEDGNLTSIGSIEHAKDPSKCQPCLFHHRQGCTNGLACRFCHFPHTPRKKSRASKRKRLRQKAQQNVEDEAENALSQTTQLLLYQPAAGFHHKLFPPVSQSREALPLPVPHTLSDPDPHTTTRTDQNDADSHASEDDCLDERSSHSPFLPSTRPLARVVPPPLVKNGAVVAATMSAPPASASSQPSSSSAPDPTLSPPSVASTSPFSNALFQPTQTTFSSQQGTKGRSLSSLLPPQMLINISMGLPDDTPTPSPSPPGAHPLSLVDNLPDLFQSPPVHSLRERGWEGGGVRAPHSPPSSSHSHAGATPSRFLTHTLGGDLFGAPTTDTHKQRPAFLRLPSYPLHTHETTTSFGSFGSSSTGVGVSVGVGMGEVTLVREDGGEIRRRSGPGHTISDETSEHEPLPSIIPPPRSSNYCDPSHLSHTLSASRSYFPPPPPGFSPRNRDATSMASNQMPTSTTTTTPTGEDRGRGVLGRVPSYTYASTAASAAAAASVGGGSFGVRGRGGGGEWMRPPPPPPPPPPPAPPLVESRASGMASGTWRT